MLARVSPVRSYRSNAVCEIHVFQETANCALSLPKRRSALEDEMLAQWRETSAFRHQTPQTFFREDVQAVLSSQH